MMEYLPNISLCISMFALGFSIAAFIYNKK